MYGGVYRGVVVPQGLDRKNQADRAAVGQDLPPAGVEHGPRGDSGSSSHDLDWELDVPEGVNGLICPHWCLLPPWPHSLALKPLIDQLNRSRGRC